MSTVKTTVLSVLAALAVMVTANSAKAQLSVGDLVISEVFANPSSGGDAGEFFEIYNTTDSTINLNGLTFTEDDGSNESFTVIADFFVGAGDFFVIGGSDGPGSDATAGQLAAIDLDWDDTNSATIDGAQSFFAIGNGADEIEIFDGMTEIFSLTYVDGVIDGTDQSFELGSIADGLDGVTTEADYVASTTVFDQDGIDAFASPGSAGLTAIPEPASAALVGLLCFGLVATRRR